MKILNLGCGNDMYGDVRVDRVKTDATTEVYNFEEGLPYKNESINEIYFKNALEHIKNKGLIIEECYRVLKKGGKIYIRTDHAGYLPMYVFPKTHEHNKMLEIHYKANGWNDELNDHHYCIFLKSHLIHLLSKFKIIECNYIYTAGRNKLTRFLLKLIPFNMGAMQIEIIGVKE